MPPDFAAYVEFVLRHCVAVSRFVRPFAADVPATRNYVQRTFTRAYWLRAHHADEPVPLLFRIALYELRRACPPRRPLLNVLAASTPLTRAAFLLVHVQELPILDVACVLQLSVGKLLAHAESGAADLARQLELAKLAGGAAVPDPFARIAMLREELPAPSWTGLEKARLAATVDEDLARGFPSLVIADSVLRSAPFREGAPSGPPVARAIGRHEDEQRRRASQQRLRLVHALAVPSREPGSGAVPLAELGLTIPPTPAQPIHPFVYIPPHPGRPRTKTRPRLALSVMAVSCMGFGAVIAHAGPALWAPPREAPSALLLPPPAPKLPPRVSALPLQPRPKLPETPSAPVPVDVSVPVPVPRALPVARFAAPPSPSPSPSASVALASPLSLAEAMQRAAGASSLPEDASAAPRPVVAASLRPSVGAVSVALGRVKGAARSCLATDDAPSTAAVVFGSNGRVQRVTVRGPASFTTAKHCIETALAKAEVPPFSDPEFGASVSIRP